MNHLKQFADHENLFELVGDSWMLITAGNSKKCNTMTASYGSFGILFGKKVAQIYVRPERYTYQFLEDEEYFSLSFFDESFKEALKYCGRISGRDEDKIQKCGFTLKFTEHDVPYFEQAKINIICKKVFSQELKREKIYDKTILNSVYKSGGDHTMYVGEIIDIYYEK